jgi:citrate lyase subunit beta/citryl-CoA lyase
MEIVAFGTTIGVGIRPELVDHINFVCFFTSFLFNIMNMHSLLWRRSWLFVPGHEPRKIERALSSAADAVILDWEDAVLPQDKAKARSCTHEACASYSGNKSVLVRINSPRSESFAGDLRALRSIQPTGIMIPKCESPDDLKDMTASFPDQELWLVPLLETPRGVLRAEEIAGASNRVAGLAFGAHDFAATTGIHPSENELEFLMARSRIVTVARAYGLAALDSPAAALEDARAVQQSAAHAYRLGFTGKLAIHPTQLEAIHAAFAPSAEEAREAEDLLRQAESRQAGAFSWKGQMVDKAVLEKARAIMQRFQAAKASAPSGKN